jgi:hypothetical protein
MPISRPLLIVLVAAVVAVFGFYATQSMRNSTDAAAPVITTTPTESPVTESPVTESADAPAARKPSAERKSSAARKPSPARKRSTTRAAGVPAPVARALDARKRIVLFFYNPGSADDRATARAVADLRGQRGLAVFTDPIGRLARYRGVIGELGISQAPAVVIVGKDRTARVIEGYVDQATLAQDVTDAR